MRLLSARWPRLLLSQDSPAGGFDTQLTHVVASHWNHVLNDVGDLFVFRNPDGYWFVILFKSGV